MTAAELAAIERTYTADPLRMDTRVPALVADYRRLAEMARELMLERDALERRVAELEQAAEGRSE